MTIKITHAGQELWYVPNGKHRTGEALTVTSIGRKWAQLSWPKTRAEIATGIVDGGEYSPPGTLYNSKEEYDDALKRFDLIYRFDQSVRAYQALAKVPTENILAAAALLGISLEAV